MKDDTSDAEGKEVASSGIPVDNVTNTSQITSPAPQNEPVLEPVLEPVTEPVVEPAMDPIVASVIEEQSNAEGLSTASLQVRFSAVGGMFVEFQYLFVCSNSFVIRSSLCLFYSITLFYICIP